jgi:hypothetical protein
LTRRFELTAEDVAEVRSVLQRTLDDVRRLVDR